MRRITDLRERGRVRIMKEGWSYNKEDNYIWERGGGYGLERRDRAIIRRITVYVRGGGYMFIYFSVSSSIRHVPCLYLYKEMCL